MSDENVLLIIDDNRQRRETIRKLFSTEFTVIESNLTDEAFQLLLSENEMVSVVLLDCTAKNSVAFDILSNIKKAPILTGLPVIAMVTWNDSDMSEYVLENGASDIISVPLIEKVVKSRVSNFVHSFFSRASTHKFLQKEQLIIAEMNSALSGQQFVIYLQPVYSLSANEAVSAEALIRWIHPEKGLISPGAFIPLFEQTGFITKLDRYVWEAVCRYIRAMLDQGKQVLPISTNISRVSLREGSVCPDIMSLVEKYNIPPSLIRFEITESAYTDNPELLLKTLKDLREQGFTILMDDFGSGYSSLNMLKDMPVDILKIDMCFLGGFETSARAGNILTSVVRMAKWLNIPVIAEGVETKGQIDFLKSIGCDKIQGFYFSRPLPVNDYEKKIQQPGILNTVEILPVMFEENDFDALFNGNQITSRLFNSVIGAIGIYEFTGDNLEVIRVNDGYYDMFGYNPQTFYEDTSLILNKIVEEDRNSLLDACRKVINGEQIEEISVQRIRTDGAMVFIGVRIRYLGGSEEHPIVCLAMNDITAKKEDEKKILLQQETLKKHNLFLQSQYDSVPCGIVRFSVEDVPKYNNCNAACLLIFGYNNRNQFEALCRDSVINMIYPDDHMYFSNMLNKRFYSDIPICIDVRIKKASGEIGYISGAIDLIETPEGKTEFQTVFMDITEEKKYESQRMLTKYSAALFTQFDQIFEFNYEKRTVSKINSKTELSFMTETTMYMDRIMSSWFSSYVDPLYRDSLEQFFKNIEKRVNVENPAESVVSSIEYRCIKDKVPAWNRITVIPVSTHLYLVCNLDITANKGAELLKEQNMKLQIKEKEHKVLQSLMQNLPIGFGIYKLGDTITPLYISPKACELLGYTYDEYMQVLQVKDSVLSPYPSESLSLFLLKLGDLGSLKSQFVFKTTKKDGTPIWINATASSRIDEDGNAINYAALTDVTEERNEMLKSERQNTLYKMLLEDTQPVIFDYNIENDEMNYSVLLPEKTREERHILHYRDKELSTTGIIKDESRKGFKKTFVDAAKKPTFGVHDFQADFLGTGYRWYRAKYKSIVDDLGKVCRIVGRATDVTDQIKYANKLKDKALLDEMTGLYNHASAVHQINAELHNQLELAVFFMIDIDNFKEVNDNFGHPIGDSVLQKVATILKDTFRGDDVKARLGGDEFAVFCPSIENKDIAKDKANIILERVADIPLQLGISLKLSVSIGIAFSPEWGCDFKTLFSNADKALYKAKNNGKDCFAYAG